VRQWRAQKQAAAAILSVAVMLLTGIESKAAAEHPDQRYIDANQIVVKGVFFVPQNGPNPTMEDIKSLNRHIRWSRERYRTMLKGTDTFEVSAGTIEIYHSSNSLKYFRDKPENGAPWYLDELFDHFGCDTNTCPYIYVIVVANDKDDYPKGCGRNFNGGFNRGGGLALMSLYALRNSPNFQSTLRHELGHAMGLVHVSNYGYDINTSDSIMSDNKKHHTNYFKESKTPGILIPEDIRSLAKNKRVFQKLTFDEIKDVPRGYKISGNINASLGAMKLPEGIEVKPIK
jgi:hypothetical protein